MKLSLWCSKHKKTKKTNKNPKPVSLSRKHDLAVSSSISSRKERVSAGVDYLEKLGHDFWKETLVLNFSDVYFWRFEHHKLNTL